jgi:hypothetical protein
MTAGKATGKDRDYQIFCRDLFLTEYMSRGFQPYEDEGIDVPFDVGGTPRTMDIALVDRDGNILVAECRRRVAKIKIMDIDAFAHRVELIRRQTSRKVAGVFFTKKQFQLGAVKSAAWEGIDVVVCNESQTLQNFVLTYQLYDANRDKRLQKALGYFSGSLTPSGSLSIRKIRADGTVEDEIHV